MISKRPKAQSRKEGGVKHGGMRGLVRYVTRLSSAGVEPLTDRVQITNSSAYDIDDFLLQVDLVQRRNTKGENKVYHLVISFPAGEHPSPEVLADIEQTLCESINAGDHQRLSVLHDDTDCLHLHVAINRVHPVTHKLNNMSKDYAARQAACEFLEIKHGLTPTSHEMKRTAAEDRAQKVMIHHGETPLIERAQAMAPSLVAAVSWAEIHTQLAANGMTIRPRGAGLVIGADGVHVKASSVAKGFSLVKLEQRLGPFQPAHEGRDAGERRAPKADRDPEAATGRGYAQPGERRDVYHDLRQQFYQERAVTTAQRSETWGAVREARAASMQAVREAASQRLAGLETITPGPVRWALSAAVRQEQAKELARARAAAAESAATARRKLAARPPVSWVDWLRARAAAGDRVALAILRRTGAAPVADGASSIAGGTPSGGAMGGEGRNDEASPSPWHERLHHVSRRGAVIYNVGQARVRDDGDRLHLQGQRSDEAIAVALQLAKERHGTTLNIEGDLAFRSRVAHVAARIDRSIRFDDPKTERLRTASVAVQQERQNDDSHRRGPGRAGPAGPDVRGRSARAGVGVGAGEPVHVAPGRGSPAKPGRAHSAAQADRATLATLRGRYPAGGIRSPIGLGNQPNLASSRASASATDGRSWPGRSLRDLPHLNMVRRTDNGSVPLPAADGRDVGDRIRGDDLSVRRAGASDRVGDPATPGALDVPSAVERYVAERNATRERVRGLEAHRAYSPVDGPVTYAGRREVDGQTLALLRAGGAVMVMEVHPDQQARIGRFKNGQGVEVVNGRIVDARRAEAVKNATPASSPEGDRTSRKPRSR
ncbi:MAG: TraI/MobA(P) family conjugative relaxase [Caulobacteraceae bacterium]